MGILSINANFTGQVGVLPRIVHIVSDDSYAVITAAGYLNSAVQQGFTFMPSDVILMAYGATSSTTTLFGLSINPITLIITLTPGTSDTILPVVSGNFASFSGTTGAIADLGYLPSNAAKTRVVMANAATVANHVMVSTDTTGTSGNLTGTAIQSGSLQAGLSGTAGTLISYPATAATGSLKLIAVSNSGDTVTTISNAAMGQASVVSIPDPATATANFVIRPAALVDTNLIKASGTAGLVADAGYKIIAHTTSSYAGGGTSNAFTATGLTTASIVTANILTSTNSVAITKVVPTSNTLTITFSADPGASTTVNYIATTAAV